MSGERTWPLPYTARPCSCGCGTHVVRWVDDDGDREVLLWGQGLDSPLRDSVVKCLVDGAMAFAPRTRKATQADVRHAIRWLCGLEPARTTEGSDG